MPSGVLPVGVPETGRSLEPLKLRWSADKLAGHVGQTAFPWGLHDCSASTGHSAASTFRASRFICAVLVIAVKVVGPSDNSVRSMTMSPRVQWTRISERLASMNPSWPIGTRSTVGGSGVYGCPLQVISPS